MKMNNNLKGKRILLLYAKFFGYDLIVKNQLEKRGAIVDLYDARADISTVEKALLKVTTLFYVRKQISFHREIINTNKNTKYDYIFTNENLDKRILLKYKSCFPAAKLLLYLDDSAENLRHVEKTFDYYDKVMTFDSKDSKKYNIQHRPLFFNDKLSEKQTEPHGIKYSYCFIGTIHSDRLNIIHKLSYFDKENSYRYLYLQSRFMYVYYWLTNSIFRKYKMNDFMYSQLKMEDVAKIMSEAQAILDIQHPKQTGLTMRTIETIGVGKKLITTNQEIKKYDFYDPSRIQVIDRDNPKIDSEFFDLIPTQFPDELFYKYSIDGWIDDVFC